jgi:hypothetical protein
MVSKTDKKFTITFSMSVIYQNLIKNHTGSNNKFLKRKVVLGKILKREKT